MLLRVDTFVCYSIGYQNVESPCVKNDSTGAENTAKNVSWYTIVGYVLTFFS